MAKSRLERQQKQQPLEADFHLLLVIESRPASNHVTEQLQVPHESPQLLLIHKGEVVLDQSHYDIQLEELVEVLAR
jgi:bacillithiol system protein YtxJ